MVANVLNRFEQPANAELDDNILNLGGTVNVDVITELTTGAGVTIDGVLLKDGNVTPSGGWDIDVQTGITAFATGGQSSATALTGAYCNVTTCATAGDSVKLLSAVTGNVQYVKNSGAATLAVFPNTSDSINALAVNLSVDVPPGCEVKFTPISTTVFETQEFFYSPAPTTQKGGFQFKAADNTSNVTVTLSNAEHGQETSVLIPDGGAATAYVAQSTAALSLAEVDVLDGVTPGTGLASKALILDSGDDLVYPATGILTLGVVKDVATTTLGATFAEINQNCDLSLNTEDIAEGGVVSVTKSYTRITSTGAGAITIAAPDATMLGKVKVIEMIGGEHDVTLALTNVQGQSSGTTATFSDINDTLVLVGGTLKWTVVGEAGIALS